MPDYVLAQGKLQTYDFGQGIYGTYGQAYCYDWPAYHLLWFPSTPIPEKNVASLYVRQSGDQLIEIGFENSWDSWDWGGRKDYRPSQIFIAFENGDYTPYAKFFVAAAEQGTWVTFEINNHETNPLKNAGDWYAAWNGRVVLHGLKTYDFTYMGQSQAAAERAGMRVGSNVGEPWIDMRGSYRYLQYKRPQGNWSPWLYAFDLSTDDYWDLHRMPGYTNYYYATQDTPYPGQ